MSLSSVSMDTLIAKLEAARAAASGLPSRAATREVAGTPQVDFGALLKSGIEHVDQSMKGASALSTRFQLGDKSVTLEETMVAMQKSQIGFQLILTLGD
jgi:flagellar hook-basal body complex protein FliE